jgi:hypothetical protein
MVALMRQVMANGGPMMHGTAGQQGQMGPRMMGHGMMNQEGMMNGATPMGQMMQHMMGGSGP